MNEEIKEILEEIDDKIIPNEHWNKIKDYITNLQEENERLNMELNGYKDEFCKDTIKEYELVMEQEYYKSRCEKAIDYINKEKGFIFNEYEEIVSDEVVNADDVLYILEGKNNE